MFVVYTVEAAILHKATTPVNTTVVVR